MLTLRQPWAWMVIHGGKRIENRKFQPWWAPLSGKEAEKRPWRGEFLIHAAKHCNTAEYAAACDFAYGVPAPDRMFAIPGSEHLDDPQTSGEEHLWDKYLPPLEELPLGGIVGVATLVDVLPPFDASDERWEHSWRMQAQYGWVLDNVRPLPFRACLGHQGFRDTPWELRDGVLIGAAA